MKPTFREHLQARKQVLTDLHSAYKKEEARHNQIADNHTDDIEAGLVRRLASINGSSAAFVWDSLNELDTLIPLYEAQHPEVTRAFSTNPAEYRIEQTAYFIEDVIASCKTLEHVTAANLLVIHFQTLYGTSFQARGWVDSLGLALHNKIQELLTTTGGRT